MNDGYVRLPMVDENREWEFFARCLLVLYDRELWDGKSALRKKRTEFKVDIREYFGEVNQRMIQLLMMSPSEREEWWERHEKERWNAYVESRLEQHGNGQRRKESPLADEDVCRGIAARMNQIAVLGGEGSATLDLRDVELPLDTPDGRIYPDAKKALEEATERLAQHTQHVLKLHVNLLIIDQVLKNARPLLELTKKCISERTKEHPPKWIKEAGTPRQLIYLRTVHDLLESKEEVFDSGRKLTKHLDGKKDEPKKIFREEDLRVLEEDGALPVNSGTILKQTRELGRRAIAVKSGGDKTNPPALPDHYSGHENGHFKQLVRDLWTDNLKESS